jgi:hypothetical protein
MSVQSNKAARSVASAIHMAVDRELVIEHAQSLWRFPGRAVAPRCDGVTGSRAISRSPHGSGQFSGRGPKKGSQPVTARGGGVHLCAPLEVHFAFSPWVRAVFGKNPGKRCTKVHTMASRRGRSGLPRAITYSDSRLCIPWRREWLPDWDLTGCRRV